MKVIDEAAMEARQIGCARIMHSTIRLLQQLSSYCSQNDSLAYIFTTSILSLDLTVLPSFKPSTPVEIFKSNILSQTSPVNAFVISFRWNARQYVFVFPGSWIRLKYLLISSYASSLHSLTISTVFLYLSILYALNWTTWQCTNHWKRPAERPNDRNGRNYSMMSLSDAKSPTQLNLESAWTEQAVCREQLMGHK